MAYLSFPSLYQFHHIQLSANIVTEWVWDGCGIWKERGKRAEADWKSFGADGKQKDLASIRVLHPRAHRCPISESQSDRKGNRGTEVNIQTGDTGGNIWVYILTMCFIWNKSGEIGNGDHKVEYRRQEWAWGVVRSGTEEELVTDRGGIVFRSIIKCISSSKGVLTSRGSWDAFR